MADSRSSELAASTPPLPEAQQMSETTEAARTIAAEDHVPSPGRRGAASPLPSLSSPSNIYPPPAYVAQFGAVQIAAQSSLAVSGRDSAVTATGRIVGDDDVHFGLPALALLNAFLDQLLYSFLANARTTGLSALRQAVTEVLKSKLASEAIASAEEELQELLAGGDDDDEDDAQLVAQLNTPEKSASGDLELIWKRTRLRVMVYIRLGEMEDDDEERYVREEKLFNSADRRFSQSTGLVSWAAAIFLTSILEYVAEQVLKVAYSAAASRAQRRSPPVPPPPGSPNALHALDDRLIVEDHDMEKVALNSSLGRVWRTWRKSARAAAIASAGGVATTSTTLSTSAESQERLQNTISRESLINTDEETAGGKNEGGRDDGGEVVTPRPASFVTARDSEFDSRRSSMISAQSQQDSDLDLDYDDDTKEFADADIPEHILAANIPLPITDRQRDIDEIECPGLAADPDESTAPTDESDGLPLVKRKSWAGLPSTRDHSEALECLVVREESSLTDEAPLRPRLTRLRSRSVPSGAAVVFARPVKAARPIVSTQDIEAGLMPEPKANAAEMAVVKREISQTEGKTDSAIADTSAPAVNVTSDNADSSTLTAPETLAGTALAGIAAAVTAAVATLSGKNQDSNDALATASSTITAKEVEERDKQKQLLDPTELGSRPASKRVSQAAQPKPEATPTLSRQEELEGSSDAVVSPTIINDGEDSTLVQDNVVSTVPSDQRVTTTVSASDLTNTPGSNTLVGTRPTQSEASQSNVSQHIEPGVAVSTPLTNTVDPESGTISKDGTKQTVDVFSGASTDLDEHAQFTTLAATEKSSAPEPTQSQVPVSSTPATDGKDAHPADIRPIEENVRPETPESFTIENPDLDSQQPHSPARPHHLASKHDSLNGVTSGIAEALDTRIGVARTSDTAVSTPTEAISEEASQAKSAMSGFHPPSRRPSRLILDDPDTPTPPEQRSTTPDNFSGKRSLSTSRIVVDPISPPKREIEPPPRTTSIGAASAIATNLNAPTPTPLEQPKVIATSAVAETQQQSDFRTAATPAAPVQPAVQQRLASLDKLENRSAEDEHLQPLTSASIKGPEDFDSFVQGVDTVRYTLTPDNVRSGMTPDSTPTEPHSQAVALEKPVTLLKSDDPPSDNRASRSIIVKQVTAATQPRPPSSDEDERIGRTAKKDKRRSVSRPPVRNTSVHRRSGLIPREPQVLTEPTTDIADFLRSTGPTKEQEVLPFFDNRSSVSVHSTRSSSVYGLRSASPARSLSRGRSKSTSRAKESSVPPVPPMPNRRQTMMQPRGATSITAGSSELIDFIRIGPRRDANQSGDHHISRSVAPFRTTMDSDQLTNWGTGAADSSGATSGKSSRKNATDAKTNSLSMQSTSYRSSTNSQAALLNNASSSGGVVHPAHSDQPQTLTSQSDKVRPDSSATNEFYIRTTALPSVPRRKDPYIIDLFSESSNPATSTSAFDIDTHDDDLLLTALPAGSATRDTAELSLSEAFRSATSNITTPPTSNNNTSSTAPRARANINTRGADTILMGLDRTSSLGKTVLVSPSKNRDSAGTATSKNATPPLLKTRDVADVRGRSATKESGGKDRRSGIKAFFSFSWIPGRGRS